ncbi:MAG: hypothetical protein M1472_00265 [Planctomycetes bacterium]|jgi:hypothetical protein|nr:hypothetical protein [Planctomycetota bacterium]
MVNQEFKTASGKVEPIHPVEDLNRLEHSEARRARSVAGQGRILACPVSFVADTGGLRKKFSQSIPMAGPKKGEPTSCPSEVFLG